MTDPVERSLERLQPLGPREELRGRVLQAVEAELRRRGGRRWDRMLAAAALAATLLGGGLIWRAGVRHEREMARLLGPRPVPRAIVELQSMFASVTDDATGARCAESLCSVKGESATAVPTTVCSMKLEDMMPDHFWKGFDNEILEESSQVDRTGPPAGRGDTSYRPFCSPVPIGQTA